MMSFFSPPFGFAGEPFLSHVPPNYPLERFLLGFALSLSCFFWLVLFPQLAESYLSKREHDGAKIEQPTATKSASVEQQKSPNGKKRDKKKKNESKNATSSTAVSSIGSSANDQQPPQEIHFEVLVASAVMCILSFVGIALCSSNNRYASRHVFEAPLLSNHECQYIIDAAHQAGERNYERALEVITMSGDQNNNNTMQDFLKHPIGWHKTRHDLYPTTDLNLVDDPFTKEDREYIQQRLDARLAPLLERVFGVSRASIRANDMFVVRYDAKDRPKLDAHTDDGDISINILLSDDFNGGGTQFWNRLTNSPFTLVQPSQIGQVITHSSQIHHEGMPVTEGTRYILVGFLAVDRVSPVTKQSTALSWFASYFSLTYMHIKFKEGYLASNLRARDHLASRWSDNKYIHAMFGDLFFGLQWIGDYISSHEHVNLVEGDEETRQAYLNALDEEYEKRGSTQPHASWFQGQQLHLDFDGSVASEWNSRRTEL